MRFPGATQVSTPNKYASGDPLEIIVIHYTAGGSASGSVAWLCDPKAKASAHFVIERDGRIWQLADTEERTWHAGGSSSSWNGGPVNRRSIGIELANWGPLKPGAGGSVVTESGQAYRGTARPFVDADGGLWEPFPEAQLATCGALVQWLAAQYPHLRTPSPGPMARIVGHQTVDPTRKRDPGPAFDWTRAAGWLR